MTLLILQYVDEPSYRDITLTSLKQTDEDGAPPGGSMHTSTPDGHSPLKLLEPFIRLKAALHENDRSIPPSLEASIQMAKISEEDPLPLLENAYAALQFLLTHRWEDQVVDELVMSMRASPHWPAALADAVRRCSFPRSCLNCAY